MTRSLVPAWTPSLAAMSLVFWRTRRSRIDSLPSGGGGLLSAVTRYAPSTRPLTVKLPSFSVFALEVVSLLLTTMLASMAGLPSAQVT